MSRPALKLLLALSFAMTGCFAEAASSEEIYDESVTDLVMEPVDGESEITLLTLPINPGGCGQLQAEVPEHCQPVQQAAPNSAAFDPDQRPPEDPNY